MTLMFPPTSHNAAAARPILQERCFSVRLRCTECDRERSQIVSMVDEPNDPATSHDFYDTGAVDRMDATCPSCGWGGAVILGVVYLRQPGDDPKSIE